jgi:hypothetical protein
VYAQLRSDPDLASTLVWIERLKEDLPRPPDVQTPPGCAYRPRRTGHGPSLRPLTAPGSTGALPTGTYRLTLTKAYLTSAGIPPGDVAMNVGVYTWTLGDGVFAVDVRPADPTVAVYPCRGYFTVTGHRAQFTRTVNQPYGDCVPPNWTATWAFDDDQIRWTRLQGFPEAYDDYAPYFAGVPWQRIG